MENINPLILEEAYKICYDYLNSPIGSKEIKFLTNNPQDVGLDTILFRNPKTIYYLQKKGVLKYSKIVGLSLIKLIAGENRQLGILEVTFNEEKTEEFVKRTLANEIDKPLLLLKNPKKEIVPFNTPLNTKWEEITIKFIDGHYVDVILGKIKERKTFREMGFEDSRTNRSDMQWKFLEDLSMNNGQIAYGGKLIIPNGKKLKQKLANGLIAYFGINNDPFYKYTKNDGYRIKIRLIPIPSQNKSLQPHSSSSQDIQEFYKELTPSEFIA